MRGASIAVHVQAHLHVGIRRTCACISLTCAYHNSFSTLGPSLKLTSVPVTQLGAQTYRVECNMTCCDDACVYDVLRWRVRVCTCMYESKRWTNAAR